MKLRNEAMLNHSWGRPPVRPPVPFGTPLVWAGGALLLGLSFWLPAAIALLRAFGELFD